MPGQMYFGNKGRMTFVKCPDTGMGMNGSRYSAEGVFLNGGAYVRNSATGHRTYDMSWNFLRADEKDDIRAYLDGVYGTGLLYFLDPFAMGRNVLPTCWASPGVAVDGGPRLVGGMANAPTAAQGPFGGTTMRTNYVGNPRPVGAASGYGVPGFARYAPGGDEDGVTMTTDAPLDTAVVRTNLVPNPSFETSLDGVAASPTVTMTRYAAAGSTLVYSGNSALRGEITGTPNEYTAVYQRVSAAPGEYIGARVKMRTSGTTARYQARVIFFNSSNTQISTGAWGAYVTGSSGVCWAVMVTRCRRSSTTCRPGCWLTDCTTRTSPSASVSVRPGSTTTLPPGGSSATSRAATGAWSVVSARTSMRTRPKAIGPLETL